MYVCNITNFIIIGHILWKRHHFIIFISAGFGDDLLEDKYILKGKSILFNITDTNQSTVKWRRTDSEISTRQLIADNINGVSPFYKERVEMNSDKSLTINNLQKKDSGIYKALTSWEDKILAEFRLTVEGTLITFSASFIIADFVVLPQILSLTHSCLNSSQMQSLHPQSYIMSLICPLEGVGPQ